MDHLRLDQIRTPFLDLCELQGETCRVYVFALCCVNAAIFSLKCGSFSFGNVDAQERVGFPRHAL